MLTIYPFLQAAEKSITPSRLSVEYAGFLGYFGVFGALGFRWFVLLRTRARQAGGLSDSGAVAATLESGEVGAARVGVVGALLLLANQLLGLSARAASKGISFGDALSAADGRTVAGFIFSLLFLLSFAIALKKVRAAWIIAALVGIAFALRNITSGKWTSLVNPLHETAASLWLGTLFVLVIVGLPAILRSPLDSNRRGALVADLIGDFSPVAIGAALLLGITGVTTAWRHLKFLAALWTTPYGYTLDIKLIVVLIVVALGAWNWKRMRPRLGAEAAAHDIRRSAKAELFFAAVVLAITGVLVSLPSPRLPHS